MITYSELLIQSSNVSGPLQYDFDDATQKEIMSLYNNEITSDEFRDITRLNAVEAKEIIQYFTHYKFI